MRSSRRLALVALITACSAGCSGQSQDAASGSGGSAGSAGAGESGGGNCAEPDLVCPNDKPYPGSACSLTDSCQYPVGDQINTWTYTCENGRWRAQSTCDGAIGGGCPIPPLAESCDAPFAGTASGAQVEIGPADTTQAFRSFTAGEKVPLIVGGQGSPMLPFRLRVAGADLGCVRIDATLDMATKGGVPTANAITLHCGESLGIFSIVPIDDCTNAATELDLHVTVDVKGVGSASATLKIDNPGCTLSG